MIVTACGSWMAPALASQPTISTVAGGCLYPDCENADGVPATGVMLSWPRGVTVDGQGNLFIADYLNFRVRKVNRSGTIFTIAGTPDSRNYNGDGIPATQAGVSPWAVAADVSGNIYIADRENARIRRVSSAGIISTVAGIGQHGFGGDGGPAVNATLHNPRDVAIDEFGALYILDQGNQRVRKVSNGVIVTVAGTGERGYNGDGIAATAASLNDPSGIAIDRTGNLYIADTGNGRVRMVSTSGTINTIAGGGPYSVDPVATNMSLSQPLAVALGPYDEIYFTTPGAVHVIGTGNIRWTAAGLFDDIRGGFRSYVGEDYPNRGDGGPATEAILTNTESIALDASGNLFIADRDHGRIRKVTPIPHKPLPVGAFAFAPPSLFPIPGRFSDISSADVNGDGRTDVVVATTIGKFSHDPTADLRVHILLQRGDGTLAQPISLRYPVNASSPTSSSGKIAIADFNNDGVVDIAIAHELGIDLIPGSRTGNFAIRSFTGSLTMPLALDIVAIDVNRDGKMDAIVSTIIPNQAQAPGLRTHFGNGAGGSAGSFEERHGHSFSELVVGDFNGDGIKDLAYSYSRSAPDSKGIAVRLHSGASILHQPIEIPTSGWNSPFALTAGDVNRDGRTDLIASISPPNLDHEAFLGWLAQDSAGQLRAPVYIPTHCSARMSAIADVNLDGMSDIVMRSCGLSLMAMTDTGFSREFKTWLPPGDDGNEAYLAVGDVNGDAIPDALVAIPGLGLQIHYGNRRQPLRRDGSQPLTPWVQSSPVLHHAATIGTLGQAATPTLLARPSDPGTGLSARMWLHRFFRYGMLRINMLGHRAALLLRLRSLQHREIIAPTHSDKASASAPAVNVPFSGPNTFAPGSHPLPDMRSALTQAISSKRKRVNTNQVAIHGFAPSTSYWWQSCLPN